MDGLKWYAECVAGVLRSVDKLSDEELAEERMLAKSMTFAARYGRFSGSNAEAAEQDIQCAVRRYRALTDERNRRASLYDDVLRCLVTGNPCGSDTWEASYVCPCAACTVYLRTHPQPEKQFLEYAAQDAQVTLNVFKAMRVTRRACQYMYGDGRPCGRDAILDAPFCLHHYPVEIK